MDTGRYTQDEAYRRKAVSWFARVSLFVLVAVGFVAALTAQASAATLISDKPDYAPGEVATFYGYGFEPGEEVVMQVLHIDEMGNEGENHDTWVVTADGDGHFETTWIVCGDDCLGSTLEATAAGQSSGFTASVQFTDSPRVGSIAVSDQSQSATTDQCAETSFTYTVTVNRGSNNSTFTANITCSGLPAGASCSPASVTLAGNPGAETSKSTTLTVMTTSATPGGNHSFTVTATATAGGGGDNASTTATLTVIGNGGTCRPSAGVCDVADSCSAGICADAKSTAVCRPSAGQCDVAESCNGVSNACPADGFASTSTHCIGASQGDTCDNDTADHCTGSDATSCVDVFQSAATVCRGSVGQCDVAENCKGTSGACPEDDVISAASHTVCRTGSGDVCDPDEECDGISTQCPADVVAGTTIVCRTGSGDVCDPDETCTGTAGQACPADTVASAGTVCNPGSGDVCDPDETCTGTAGQACPADTVASAGTVCNPGSGDVCDPNELCPGVADQGCPADQVASNTTVCNSGSGDLCDPDEHCTGAADAACPSDTVASAGTVCRAASDLCDVAEKCTGTTDQACPGDTVVTAASNTTCRVAGANATCDPADTCDGINKTCPVNYASSGTPCGGSDTDCDALDTCNGSGSCTDNIDPNTTVCRTAAGVCDVEEKCTGSSKTCPDEGFQAAGTACGSGYSGNVCIDQCDGTQASCQHPNYNFNGFFQPVDNNPVMNKAKAGSAVPVKFSLGGNKGLNIFWPGYPKSQLISCSTTAPLDDIEETVTAGGSSLQYDATTDKYIYVWKTDRSWTGCRQLLIRFSPTSCAAPLANFYFFK